MGEFTLPLSRTQINASARNAENHSAPSGSPWKPPGGIPWRPPGGPFRTTSGGSEGFRGFGSLTSWMLGRRKWFWRAQGNRRSILWRLSFGWAMLGLLQGQSTQGSLIVHLRIHSGVRWRMFPTRLRSQQCFLHQHRDQVLEGTWAGAADFAPLVRDFPVYQPPQAVKLGSLPVWSWVSEMNTLDWVPFPGPIG